ncbi:MAG: hypothetical protein QM784_10240 [Polyangiaceae bacterium]
MATAITNSAWALPSTLTDYPTLETLRRANLAIQGHPAAAKVTLLPEASIAFKPSNVAHVLPLQAKAELELKSITAPRCDLMQSATDAVNTAIDALAILAQSLLDEANRISALLDAHAAYVLEHSAELALAAEGEAKILAAESVVTFLLGELMVETDPDLIEYYNAELVTAQRDVAAARNDPAYMKAFSVKKQADALMDEALGQYEAWDLEYTTKFEAGNAALAAAQSVYDDLSATEIAAVDARMPIWDQDVISLLKTSGGVRRGVRFVPATLEDLRWTLQDANLPRIAPIQIEIYGAHQEELNGASRVESLPGLVDTNAPPPMQQPNVADYGMTNTVFAQGTMDRTFSRDTRPLVVSAPLVHAGIPLGAYCGSLHTVQTTPAVVYGKETSASLLVKRYDFAPRERAAVESYLGTVDYKVKVQGPPARVTCTLDLGRYAAATQGKPANLNWLWQHYGEWDDLILERLRRLGVYCSVSGEGELRALNADRVLREALAWAVSDVWWLMQRYTYDAGKQALLPEMRIAYDDDRLAGQYALCDGTLCRAPALLATRAFSRVFGPRITGHCSWSPLFWKSEQLHSQIDFRMPVGL